MGANKLRKMGLKKFPKRGEVYFVCLDPTVGAEINKTRPALIISNDIGNKFAETITIIPIIWKSGGQVFYYKVFGKVKLMKLEALCCQR